MLFWHGIVKDEARVIQRCLDSIIPHVDGAVVVDTGSTDGTPELIRQAFSAAEKPVWVPSITFENFSQARNEALALARTNTLPWDYLLLADADMELKVSDPGWMRANGGLAYDIAQVSATWRFWNTRLLSRASDGLYKSPTHEFLDVPSAGRLDGVWFVDHADGANRVHKLERDLKLLLDALKDETDPGLVQRYHFYIAQTYFDLGQHAHAADWYLERSKRGGWDEEVWYAQYRYAICQFYLNEHDKFVCGMLKAYEMRPSRVEPLHVLAKYYRERGDSQQSLLMSAAGLDCKLSQDALFVDTAMYLSGVRDEYAICAYYNEVQRSRGARICDEIALDPTVPAFSREQARSNLYWYVRPLIEHVPSFETTRLNFVLPEGWVGTNPSIVNLRGRPIVLLRSVNYKITDEGQYVSRLGEVSDAGVPIIRTRNWLLSLAADISVTSAVELQMPSKFPLPEYTLVRGFEDSRLFGWRGSLWALSTMRELTPEGWCEQVLGMIRVIPEPTPDGDAVLGIGYSEVWYQVLPEMGRFHEKNWMPWVREDGNLRIVYRLGTILDENGNISSKVDLPWDVEHLSGGSQVIGLPDGRSIAIVHEARTIPGRPNRFYMHRFVLLLPSGMVMAISRPFYFHDKQIEFCAGLALFEDKLVASYGVRDEEAWIATFDLQDVLKFMDSGSMNEN